jgi:hypothetical protein
MVAVGDIVRVKRFPGLWGVLGPVPSSADPSPAGRLWRVQQWRGLQAHPLGYSASAGQLEVLAHPEFSPGQILSHWGEAVVVVADDGGDTVRIRIPRRRPVEGSAGIDMTGETDAARGALVAVNAEALLAAMEVTQ